MFENCDSSNIQKWMFAFFMISTRFTAKFEFVFCPTQENAFFLRFNFKANNPFNLKLFIFCKSLPTTFSKLLFLTLFFPIFPFDPLNTLENQNFYDVFRGIKRERWKERVNDWDPESRIVIFLITQSLLVLLCFW